MRTSTVRRALASGLGATLLGLVIAYVFRESIFRWFASFTASGPSWLDSMISVFAEYGPLALAVLFGAVALHARVKGLRQVSVAILTGLAVVAAYLCSEIIKALALQVRPCRTLTVPDLLASCPAVGDWSWPSNHATVSSALAVAVIVLAPRMWRWVVPLALCVAFLRVAVGVHYLHDVLAGLILGAVVVLTLTVGLEAAVLRAVARLNRWTVANHLFLAKNQRRRELHDSGA